MFNHCKTIKLLIFNILQKNKIFLHVVHHKQIVKELSSEKMFADLTKPENKDCFVVCDFRF